MDADLNGFAWSKAPRGAQVAVSRKLGALLQFQGVKAKVGQAVADPQQIELAAVCMHSCFCKHAGSALWQATAAELRSLCA